MADIVPVERIGVTPRLGQLALHEVGDGGLARARQAREPQHSRFLALHVGAARLVHIHGVSVDVAGPAQGELDHAGAHRLVGEAVDQDEGAGLALILVRIKGDGPRGRERADADFVQLERLARLFLEAVDVQLVLEGRDGYGRDLSAGLEQIGPSRKHFLLSHPEDFRGELVRDFRALLRVRQHVATCNVDFTIKDQRDGVARPCGFEIAIGRHHAADLGRLAGMRDDHIIAGRHGA